MPLAFSQEPAYWRKLAIVADCALGVVGTGSGSGVGGLPGVSPHVTGSLRSTPVERDDVEIIEQAGRQHAQLVGHVVDAGDAGAAGIDHERADAVGRHLGRMASDGDRDRLSVGGVGVAMGTIRLPHCRSPLQGAQLDRRDRWVGHGYERGGRRGGWGRRRCDLGRVAVRPCRRARLPACPWVQRRPRQWPGQGRRRPERSRRVSSPTSPGSHVNCLELRHRRVTETVPSLEDRAQSSATPANKGSVVRDRICRVGRFPSGCLCAFPSHPWTKRAATRCVPLTSTARNPAHHLDQARQSRHTPPRQTAPAAPGPLGADRRHEVALALGRAFPPYAPSGTSHRPTGAAPPAQ